MSEDEIELEWERDRSRSEVADLLTSFADGLREGETVTVALGDKTIEVHPPETVEFEIELEDEPEDGGVERSVEFELEWMRTDDEEPLPDPEEFWS